MSRLSPHPHLSLEVEKDDDNKSDNNTNNTQQHYGTMSSSSPPPPQSYIPIDDAMEHLGMGKFQYQILWAAGLCFMADAMEVLLLSFLAPILAMEWDLTETQMDTIISVVFAGALLGTLILSPLGDMVGRKPMFRVTAAMIAIFGVLTAACQNYNQLLIMRFLVGFGVGGLTVPFDTLSEFLPLNCRGRNLLAIEFFWTFGTLSVPMLAYFSLQYRGEWPLFVILCSIPCIVSTVLGIVLVPESPRWLLEQGRSEEALEIMKLAAKTNGKNPDELFPEGTVLFDPLHQHDHDQDNENGTSADKGATDATAKTDSLMKASNQSSSNNNSNSSILSKFMCDGSSIRELFSPTWRRITLLLWGSWLGLGFLYYGVIIAVSIVFSGNGGESYGRRHLEDNNNNNNNGNGGITTYYFYRANDDEVDVYDFDYSAILISASAEIFGLLAVLYTIDRYGRIPSQTVAYWAGGIATFALGILGHWGSPRFLLIAIAFLARMAMMGATCTTWVSTSEILSTDIRATGHGAANAMARMGGFACPYFITQGNSLAMIGTLVLVIALGTAECSRRLPETAGKAMGELDAVDNNSDGGSNSRIDNNASMSGSVDLSRVATQESVTVSGTRNSTAMTRREIMEQTASVSQDNDRTDSNNKKSKDDDDEPTTSYHQIL